METVLRALRLLALTVWVGGIAFLSFVVAPVAFHRLPNPREAGMVVGGSLTVLHRIGLAAGIVFLAATVVLWLRGYLWKQVLWRRGHLWKHRTLSPEIALIFLMLAITGYLQYRLLPTLERTRLAAGGSIRAADPGNKDRIRFQVLHTRLEWLEGVVLLSGVVIVLLVAGDARVGTIEHENRSYK